MRKIKKALALSLALAMGLSLVACGDKTDNSTTESKSSEATSEAASSEDASSEEASSEDASGAAKIEAPSTDGWDDSKKIYAYYQIKIFFECTFKSTSTRCFNLHLKSRKLKIISF